ncbi:MAG: YkgJ family cysteine cluster protein, partial [Desulfocapsaceae bacterium]|jgi:Fe-S-cluster containining protein|nr:YkgJ family cysteine cluster protein [Desulfocapsaceae bacterium]
LPLAQLITIRAGELAHNPLTGRLQPVKRELVKISGVGHQWNCCYLDPEEKSCTIYDKRPKACRVLKCWDTREIEELIENDTIGRLDIVPENDPVRPFLVEHDTLYPCPDMIALTTDQKLEQSDALEDLVNREIGFRTRVVENFDLSLGEELFYFGRPIFHLLVSIGAQINEVDGRLLVSWPVGKMS